VTGELFGTSENEIVLIQAHMDTVFADSTRRPRTARARLLYCAGDFRYRSGAGGAAGRGTRDAAFENHADADDHFAAAVGERRRKFAWHPENW